MNPLLLDNGLPQNKVILGFFCGLSLDWFDFYGYFSRGDLSYFRLDDRMLRKKRQFA